MNTITRENLIRDVAALNNHFNDISVRSKAVDHDIQLALCSAVLHLHVHGTIAVANNAIAALSKGLRTNAARDFMIEYAPVNWNEKKKAFVFAAKKRNEAFEETEKFTEMLGTLWVSFRPEPVYKPFDAMAQLSALLKKAERHMAEPNEADKVGADEIALIKAAIEQIGAKRTEKEAEKVQAALVEDEQAEQGE